jgi:hypothetical protein
MRSSISSIRATAALTVARVCSAVEIIDSARAGRPASARVVSRIAAIGRCTTSGSGS